MADKYNTYDNTLSQPNYNQSRENQLLRQFTFDDPKGWLIMDTFNNPFFPLDVIQVDTERFDLDKIKTDYHKYYGGKPDDLFLPWHYTIEYVQGRPYIINTRPFNYLSTIKSYEKHLSIMIIGDSNKDIYSPKFYQTIANLINPFRYMRGFYLSNQKNIFEFKTGENFNKNYLFSLIR